MCSFFCWFFVRVSPDENLNMRKEQSAVVGSVLSSLFLTPLDILKTRLQLNKGVSNIYRATLASTLINTPQTVFYYLLYDNLRSSQSPLISGIIARLTTAILASPFELIKTRILGNVDWRVISFRGLLPTLCRDVPFSSIYWVIYEKLKSDTMDPRSRFISTFSAGAFSGSIAAFITTPFDVVKTVLQTGDNNLKMRFVIRDIYSKKGVRGLFAGWVPRVARISPACAIMISAFEVGSMTEI